MMNVLLIGCSTGCSLIHIALGQNHEIKAAIYISPNFGPKPIKGQALRILGDILSPSQTQIDVQKILSWLDNVYLRNTLVNM